MKRQTLALIILAGSLILSACGGDSKATATATPTAAAAGGCSTPAAESSSGLCTIQRDTATPTP